ncbi:related to acid phosphatase ACP2 precursor [Serendipita indica DSM 11827]|uniref:Related to acid phosphatase ACP2 n=1 Tax=Serendipita indica (strain DSM 11827) TaxID=1109443 RepID=G4TA57_SERID|nr:related to acid phosphatase ACP2 precursor [Serendipita indica DSM 11827]
MTTASNIPKLDPDAYPEQPTGLSLEQVHVYVRHGERTPVGTRMNNPPANIPEHWPLCRGGRKFSAGILQATENKQALYSPGTIDIERVVEFRNGSSTSGICMLGELTDVGRGSTHDFGKALRKIYIERLGFLPDSTQDTSPVYYRSTNVPRTIESLQQIINGLYPNGKNLHRPQLLVRNAKDENIIPNHFSCKRLERLAVSFAQAAAEKLNPTLKPLDKRLSKYLDGEPVRVDGKPRASGILDTIRAAKAHNIRVPREFNDQSTMDLIEFAVVTEWFGGYKNPEYRRLAMGPLLDDLQRKMQQKVEQQDQDPLKLLVYSTHDTAVAGITNAFDVFDHRWPDFTASVTFELFKQSPQLVKQAKLLDFLPSTHNEPQAPSPTHFVRMRYQNKSLPLPACAKPGDHLPGHPEFCTLQAFQRHIKELTPEDWDTECIPPPPVTPL